jgi:hypothetical protein
MVLIFNKEKLLLNFSFFISLFSILFSILISAFYNKFVSFYYLTYLFSIYFLIYYLISFKSSKVHVYYPLFILICYILFITTPITIALSDLTNLMVFVKNNLLFIPLFLYYKLIFKDNSQVIKFLKYLIFGGIFFSLYIIFEFVNKLFLIYPYFNTLIFEYLSKSKNDYLAVFADTDKLNLESAIRPLGLELNFTSGAFFLSSIFMILLFSGWRYIINTKYRTLIQFILLISIFISSSRQNIIFLTFFLLIIFLQNILGLLSERLKVHNNQLKYSLNFIVFTIIIIALFLFSNEEVYTNFITGKSGGTTEILFDDFNSLFDKLYFLLINYPFNFLFGIGAYTPENPGLYFKLKSVNELHFLLDTFYTFGIFGFIIFWNLFYNSLKKLYVFKNSNKLQLVNNFDDIKAAFFYITILFFTSNIHYSPIGLTSIYIIALIIYIPTRLKNE